MKSSFKNESLPKTLEMDAKFSQGIRYKVALRSSARDPLLSFFSESCTIRNKKVFGRSNRGASATGVSHADRLEQGRGIWDQIKVTYDIPEQVDKEFSEFARYVIYTPQTDFLRGRQSGRVDTPPIGLHGEGLPEAVSTFLDVWREYHPGVRGRKTVEPYWNLIDSCVKLVWLPGWASMFGVHHAAPLLTSRDLADRSSETVYFTDKFMHASRNRLSVYDSSKGTLFLLFAAIILAHPRSPKVFALDNVDNALDAFDLFDDDQRVFVVQRNEKGHTTAERLKPPKGMTREKWELVKNGRNLSQLWLDGDIPVRWARCDNENWHHL
jgi:hypothetical protein